jgi:hypothetical protein
MGTLKSLMIGRRVLGLPPQAGDIRARSGVPLLPMIDEDREGRWLCWSLQLDAQRAPVVYVGISTGAWEYDAANKKWAFAFWCDGKGKR